MRFGVLALDFGGSESVLDVEGTGIESTPLVGIGMTTLDRSVLLIRPMDVSSVALSGFLHLRPDSQSVSVESGFSSGPDLLVDDLSGLGGLHGLLDAHGLGVEVARSDFGDVLAAVDLLVVLTVLVVEVSAEGQFA